MLVNLGANDSGFCTARDVDCAYRSIMHLVDTIGPGHRIWWPKITRFPYYRSQQDTWNAALDRVAAERTDFFTWDWPTVMADGPFPTPDNTHLGPDGYRLRSRLMAEAFTAALARGERIGGDAPDPMVAMAYGAGRTTNLKFGMSVMVLPGRNPIVLAKALASLSTLSGGRLLPAFGLGLVHPLEQQAFGVERTERAALFNETLHENLDVAGPDRLIDAARHAAPAHGGHH